MAMLLATKTGSHYRAYIATMGSFWLKSGRKDFDDAAPGEMAPSFFPRAAPAIT
jgi:hypothetical protein